MRRLLLAVLFCGCTPRPADPPAGTTSADVDDTEGADAPVKIAPERVSAKSFFASYADTLCNNVEPCCTAASLSYDANACRAAVAEKTKDLTHPIEKNAATACLAYLADAVKSCVALNNDNPCTPVLTERGDKLPGEPCEAFAECRSSRADGYPFCAADGLCREYVRGAIGDLCVSQTATTLAICPAEAYCPPSALGTSACSLRLPVGAKCKGDECQENAYCPVNASAATCTARVSQGGDCSFDTYACAAGLYCDHATCVPIGAVGEPCNPAGSPLQCAVGLYCDGTKKCRAPPLANASLCGVDPLIGSWQAWSIALASVDGDVTADASFDLATPDAISFSVAVRDDRGWIGTATFTGTFTSARIDDSYAVHAIYAGAIVKTGSGSPVAVTGGTCPKHNDCDALVFGDGNPFPEPCFCKKQIHVFQPLGQTELQTELFGEETTFYLQR